MISIIPEISLMTDDRKFYVINIGKMYERVDMITGIGFNYFNVYHSFIRKKEFRDVPARMIIEEMIHLCLPSPEDRMSRARIDDSGTWKFCLIKLLLDYQKRNANR